MVLPVADVNGEFIGAFQLINKNSEKGFDIEEDSRKLSLPALICGLALESDTFLDDAHHDRLTKLKNRIGFYSDFSKKYMKYLDGKTDKPLSMFICDIDKFKLVNDTYILASTFAPNVVEVRDKQYFDERAADALEKMLSAAEKAVVKPDIPEPMIMMSSSITSAI